MPASSKPIPINYPKGVERPTSTMPVVSEEKSHENMGASTSLEEQSIEDYARFMIFKMDLSDEPVRAPAPVTVPAKSPDDLNKWFNVVERSNYTSRPITQAQSIKHQTGIVLVAHSLFYCSQQAGTSQKPLKENSIDKYPDIDKGEIFIMD